MLKALNEIKATLKLIDIVIEVLDSRLPLSSQNYMINDLAENKKRIVVLNKYDIADPEQIKLWKKYFEEKQISVILTNGQTGENVSKIIDEIKKIGNELYSEKLSTKKVEMKPIYRAVIVGIPNVGKSTIINKLSKKNSAAVGNKPGVTVRKQWIRLADNIELMDTPGLLWPKLDEYNAGVKLALTGNIKQEILDEPELAIEGIKILCENEKYKKMLKEKYDLKDENVEDGALEILEAIGKRRGCIISGGKIDTERASKLFLDDFKNGKIGKINLDLL